MHTDYVRKEIKKVSNEARSEQKDYRQLQRETLTGFEKRYQTEEAARNFPNGLGPTLAQMTNGSDYYHRAPNSQATEWFSLVRLVNCHGMTVPELWVYYRSIGHGMQDTRDFEPFQFRGGAIQDFRSKELFMPGIIYDKNRVSPLQRERLPWTHNVILYHDHEAMECTHFGYCMTNKYDWW